MDKNNTAIPGLTTTYPYESTDPGVARHQCEECGGWQRADKADKGMAVGEIRHSKNCDSKPQIPAVAEVLAAQAAKSRRSELERFAARVRRTGLTSGRDADVAECVRLGLLTAGAAMNTDD